MAFVEKVIISDGTDDLAISATGAALVDGSAVTQPVSGTVSVSNFPATQPVSGTVSVSNFPASQAVTGAFTNTEYAEDSPSASGATGNFILGVRNDTYAAVTSLDGDYSAISVNSRGAVLVDIKSSVPLTTYGLTDAEIRASPVPVTLTSTTITGSVAVTSATFATSALQTTGNTSLSNIDTKTPALGQALAAASTPVVLTAIQQAALTPPAAITGFALAANQQNDALTNTQLRAVAVPVSGTVAVSNFPASQAVTGTFFQVTQPVSGTVTINAIPAGTNNIGDVDVLTLPAITIAAAQTLSTVTTVGAVTSITNALPAGNNNIGDVDVLAPTLTKGTQGATGFTIQNLKDAGRNVTNHFMVAPIITTVAEVMQSLTGYKSGAAVTTTTTPAVVTTGKIYRINEITLTYFNVAAVGSARFTLRANTAGVAIISSPLVWSKQIGISGDGTSTAGHVTTMVIPIPDGLEFAAGTGIAIGMQGFGAVPTTGTIVGYGKIEISGYEY